MIIPLIKISLQLTFGELPPRTYFPSFVKAPSFDLAAFSNPSTNPPFGKAPETIARSPRRKRGRRKESNLNKKRRRRKMARKIPSPGAA